MKLQVNFFFATIGVPILTEDPRHFVSTQVKTGLKMLNSPKSLFTFRNARPVPSTPDLVKLLDYASLTTLSPKYTGSKHKLRNFVSLPPDLLAVVMETDLSVTSVLLRVSEFI